MAPDVFIHPTAIVETERVGPGTRIWAFTHALATSSIGADCNIGEHCFIESGVTIGDGVTIKNGNMIWTGVTIEDGAFVGPDVHFTNDRHPRSPRLPQAAERYRDDSWLDTTVVRRGASIGAGAAVLPGVEVGAFATVAAAAVVTRDVPAHAVVRGNPARVSGWVCECGRPLAATDPPTVDHLPLQCEGCGRSYRLRGHVVEGTGSSGATASQRAGPPAVVRGVAASYEMAAMIRSDALGVIWTATDSRRGRHVSLRLLDPALVADTAERSRIAASVDAVSRLSHPAIAAVLDHDLSATPPFLAYQLLPETTLERELAFAPLRPTRVRRVLAPVAEALAQAHANGVAHGNLTAAGVGLDERGRPLLADLGLARTADDHDGEDDDIRALSVILAALGGAESPNVMLAPEPSPWADDPALCRLTADLAGIAGRPLPSAAEIAERLAVPDPPESLRGPVRQGGSERPTPPRRFRSGSTRHWLEFALVAACTVVFSVVIRAMR